MGICNLAVLQEDILSMIPMEGLIATVADDLRSKHLDPHIVDMILGLHKACQIKLARVLGVSHTGTVREARSGNLATRNHAITGINVERGKANMSVGRRETSSAPVRRTVIRASIASVGEIKIFNVALWKTWVALTPPMHLIMRGGRICRVRAVRGIPPVIDRGCARCRSRHQRRQTLLGRQECKNLLKASLAGRVVLLDCRGAFQEGSLGGGHQIAHSSSHIHTN